MTKAGPDLLSLIATPTSDGDHGDWPTSDSDPEDQRQSNHVDDLVAEYL